MTTSSSSRVTRFSVRVYRRLLVVYPRAFRAGFGEQMALTFRDQCRDAWNERGFAGLAALWLRVLLDLLRSAPAEHLAGLEKARAFFARRQFSLQTEGGSMEPQFTSEPGGRAGGWRAALLAALPMLVAASFIIIPAMLGQTDLPENTARIFNTSFLVTLGLGLAITLLVAWRKRFPDWSASWMIIWLLLIIMLPITYLSDVVFEAHLPLYDLALAAALLLSGYVFYRLARRDLILAVIAALPLVLFMGIASNEFVQPAYTRTTQVVTCLAAAAIAYNALRSGRWKRALLLSVGLSVLLGAAQAYGAEFLIRNAPAVEKNWREFLVTFTALSLPRVALLVGPGLAVAIRTLGLRSGRRGGPAYRLVLAGVLLSVLVLLLETFIASSGDFYATPLLARRLISAGLIVGPVISLAGWALMVWGLLKEKVTPPRHTALLVALPVLLPYVLAFFAKSIGISVGIFRGMSWNTVYIYCAVGFLWAIVSSFTVILANRAKP